MFVQCGHGHKISSLHSLHTDRGHMHWQLKLWHIVLVLTMPPCTMSGTAKWNHVKLCQAFLFADALCVSGKYHRQHELLQQALTLMHWQMHVSSAQGLAKGRGLVGMPALCPVTQTPALHANWSCSKHATVADLLYLSSVISCRR